MTPRGYVTLAEIADRPPMLDVARSFAAITGAG
jgi:hypothetical protein